MEAQSAAGFGPVLFIGLTFAALVTHTPPNPDLPNPQDSTDFDRHPQIMSAVIPVIEVPALAFEQQIARLDAKPIPAALEADARVAARPLPEAIEVASYPDMPDQFLGYEAPTTEVPSIATQVWATTAGAAEPSVAGVSALEVAPIADTQAAPVKAAQAMPVPPLPAHPETAVASFDGWPEIVWDMPQSRLVVLHTEDALDPSTDGWATVTGNFVNMRRDPDLTGARIDQFFRGNRLIVTRVDDGWARVNEPSNPPQTGWMSVEYLELDLR
ncbi:SH3 domain-containing protein [Shimia ponticola]|uniref:SH3 domain-containing protein n=1 Tax=Shimia ponticola TaxID=2582893 RepID=UPI0011BF5956|nr:SH3 domain-containing protein [Shimia ponticola]